MYNWINLYKSEVLSKEKSFTHRETNQFKQTVKRQSDMIKILKSVNCTVNSSLKDKLYELEKLYGSTVSMYYAILWRYPEVLFTIIF